MKKLILTLALLGAVSFSYAADKADDKAAPAKEEKCCNDGEKCCKDKAHAKDCKCDECKAACEKKADCEKKA